MNALIRFFFKHLRKINLWCMNGTKAFIRNHIVITVLTIYFVDELVWKRNRTYIEMNVKFPDTSFPPPPGTGDSGGQRPDSDLLVYQWPPHDDVWWEVNIYHGLLLLYNETCQKCYRVILIYIKKGRLNDKILTRTGYVWHDRKYNVMLVQWIRVTIRS